MPLEFSDNLNQSTARIARAIARKGAAAAPHACSKRVFTKQ